MNHKDEASLSPPVMEGQQGCQVWEGKKLCPLDGIMCL